MSLTRTCQQQDAAMVESTDPHPDDTEAASRDQYEDPGLITNYRPSDSAFLRTIVHQGSDIVIRNGLTSVEEMSESLTSNENNNDHVNTAESLSPVPRAHRIRLEAEFYRTAQARIRQLVDQRQPSVSSIPIGDFLPTKPKIKLLPFSDKAPNVLKPSIGRERKSPPKPESMLPHQLGDEWFVHSESNSHPAAGAFMRLPFDLWQCTPFWSLFSEYSVRLRDHVLVTREEFDQTLSALPELSRRFQAEAISRARRRGQTDNGLYQAEAFRAANLADDDTEDEEAMPANAHSASWTRKGAVWLEEWDPRYAMWPAPSDMDDSETCDDEDEDPTDHIEYGVDDRSRPPWINQLLTRWLRWFTDTCGLVLYDEAFECQLAARSVPYEKRCHQNWWSWRGEGRLGEVIARSSLQPQPPVPPKKQDNPQNTPPSWLEPDLLLRVGKSLFGEWAVVENSAGNLEWASYPPNASEGWRQSMSRQERYQNNIRAFVRTHASNFQRNEKRAYEAILQADVAFKAEWGRMKDQMNAYKKNSQIPAVFVVENLNSFLTALRAYGSLTTSLPLWATIVEKALLKRAYNLSILSPEQLLAMGVAISPDELSEIIKEHRIHTAETNHEADHQGPRMDRVENPIVADSEEYDPPPEIEAMLNSDYGVTPFATWDPVELIQYLGFESIQNPQTWPTAVATDKGRAHLTVKEGGTDKLAGGKKVYVDPQAHALRHNVIWPYIKRFSNVKAPELWEEAIKSAKHGTRPEPTEKTHEQVQPKWHQMVAVASILSRGYCDNAWTEPSFATLIADEVGFGKTWIPFMLAGALRYHREHSQADGSFRPPVFDPNKTEWKVAEPNPERPRTVPSWIGERRLGTFAGRGRLHLMLSNRSIYSGHLRECELLATAQAFRIHDYVAITRNDRTSRTKFWQEVRTSLSQGFEVVVLATYGRLELDAKQAPSDPEYSSSYATNSLFDRDLRYATVFVDEIAEMRNPRTRVHFAVHRIAERAGYVMGATATPIYTSAFDIINIGRCLGLPNVVERPEGLHWMNLETAKTDGGLPSHPYESRKDIRGLTIQASTVIASCRELSREGQKIRSRIARFELSLVGDTSDKRGRPTRNPREPGSAVNPMVLPAIFQSSDEGQAIAAEYERHLDRLESELLQPLRYMFARHAIRRSYQSVDCCGTECSRTQPIQARNLWVTMSPQEVKEYNSFEASLDEKDRHFDAKLRRFLREPHGIQHTFWDPKRGPPAAVRRLLHELHRILDEDAELEETLRRKIVIHTHWTSLVPFFQIYLAKEGIGSRALTGEDTETERASIIRDFQKDVGMQADVLLEGSDSQQIRLWDPVTARVLFISGVGTTGITLDRGSEIFLLDPAWSFADRQQIIGRVNRMNQTRPVHAYAIYVRQTCEEKMYRLEEHKKHQSNRFLGQRSMGDVPATPADGPETRTDQREASDVVDEDLEAERQRKVQAYFNKTLPAADPLEKLRRNTVEAESPSGAGKKRRHRASTASRKLPKTPATIVDDHYDQSDADDQATILALVRTLRPMIHPNDVSCRIDRLDTIMRRARYSAMKRFMCRSLDPDISYWGLPGKDLILSRTLLCRLFRSEDPEIKIQLPHIIDLTVSPWNGSVTNDSLRWPHILPIIRRLPDTGLGDLKDPSSYPVPYEIEDADWIEDDTALQARPQDVRDIGQALYTSLGTIRPVEIPKGATTRESFCIARANHVRRLLARCYGVGDPVKEAEMNFFSRLVKGIVREACVTQQCVGLRPGCAEKIDFDGKIERYPEHDVPDVVQLSPFIDEFGQLTQCLWNKVENFWDTLIEFHPNCGLTNEPKLPVVQALPKGVKDSLNPMLHCDWFDLDEDATFKRPSVYTGIFRELDPEFQREAKERAATELRLLRKK